MIEHRLMPLSMTLNDPLPRIQSRRYSTLNISETIQDMAIVTVECHEATCGLSATAELLFKPPLAITKAALCNMVLSICLSVRLFISR